MNVLEILKHSALSCDRLKSALAADLTMEPAVPSGSVWLGFGNSTEMDARGWGCCGRTVLEGSGVALGGCSRLRDGCANGTGAEIPSSTVHGWAQGHLVRVWGRGAERGDGGDGDGGSAGVFALGVCLCCRALNRGHRVTPRPFGARGRAAGRQGRKLFSPRAGRGARSILRLLLCLRFFTYF